VDRDLAPTTPLGFSKTDALCRRILDNQGSTGLRDAVSVGFCRWMTGPLALGVDGIPLHGRSMGIGGGRRRADPAD